MRRDRISEPIARIHVPWAKDALGRPLATHYDVDGDRLIQHVMFSEHTPFPVVADPRLEKRWWGRTWHFSRMETVGLAAGSAACTAVAGSIVAASGGTSAPIAGTVAVICGAAAAFTGVLAGSDDNACLAIKQPFIGPSVPWVERCR